MSLALTRYKAKLRVLLYTNVSCLYNTNGLQKTDCFLKKISWVDEDLKIKKDIAKSPNYKKYKSSLQSEVSQWCRTERKKIWAMSNCYSKIEFAAAFLTLRMLLHNHWRIFLLLNLCVTYTRLFYNRNSLKVLFKHAILCFIVEYL